MRAVVGWMPVILLLLVTSALKAQPTSRPTTVPSSRAGGDLVGRAFVDLHFTRWLRTEGDKPLETAGHVTLYRWWTDECPFCRATLPAIETLRTKYAERGFRVVAVYHPKPVRAVSDKLILAAAQRIGYGGAIAVDEDWAVLKQRYLSTGRRGATSVSILVDRNGTIRFIHPGTSFFPSAKADEAQENSDYQAMEAAIGVLLDDGQ